MFSNSSVFEIINNVFKDAARRHSFTHSFNPSCLAAWASSMKGLCAFRYQNRFALQRRSHKPFLLQSCIRPHWTEWTGKEKREGLGKTTRGDNTENDTDSDNRRLYSSFSIVSQEKICIQNSNIYIDSGCKNYKMLSH